MTNAHHSFSDSLPLALLRARERITSPVRSMLAEVGLTEQQWRVLRVLHDEGPQDPTRIAAQSCLLLPSLTRILQKLDEKGLIVRTPDPDDRRKQIVGITGLGEAVIAANLEPTLRVLDDLRDEIGSERYDLLVELLNQVEQVRQRADAAP
ncbi:MAG: MarR family transcriptional regulator [Marinibacterium sp.]|nr:MarR family transcriptional regulator [Marinibacterium sp.]